MENKIMTLQEQVKILSNSLLTFQKDRYYPNDAEDIGRYYRRLIIHIDSEERAGKDTAELKRDLEEWKAHYSEYKDWNKREVIIFDATSEKDTALIMTVVVENGRVIDSKFKMFFRH